MLQNAESFCNVGSLQMNVPLMHLERYCARPPASLFPLGFPFSPKPFSRSAVDRERMVERAASVTCHSPLTNLI